MMRPRPPARFYLPAVLTVIALAAGPGHAAAAEPAPDAACALKTFAEGAVAAVIDGRTFRLRDGRVVRIAALELPPDAIDRDTGRNPFAESRRALTRMLDGRGVILKRMPQTSDRYGRLWAHVVLTPGGTEPTAAGAIPPAEKSVVWLDEQLLAGGFGLRGSEAIAPGCHARLIAAEAAAREAGRGLWDTPNSFVRDAANGAALAARRGRFVIAEGEIVSENAVGSTTYLNFGRIWRDSLTAVILKRDARRFRESGRDPQQLLHRKVRLRGWVEQRLGPTLVLHGPEQMEIIGR